jgi:hypothetical protein
MRRGGERTQNAETFERSGSSSYDPTQNLAYIPLAYLTKGTLGSRAKARQDTAFVAPHQAEVADNVCSDDRRQFGLLTGSERLPRAFT